MPVTLHLSPKPPETKTVGTVVYDHDMKVVLQSLVTAMHVSRKGVEARVMNSTHDKKTHATYWLRACSTHLRLTGKEVTLLMKEVPQKVLTYAPEDALVAYLPEIIGQKAAKVALAYGVVGKKT